MSKKESDRNIENSNASEAPEVDLSSNASPDLDAIERALNVNPDQFPSVANLRIPDAEKIEPFQIVDSGRTIAASRKIELAGNRSFHEGMKAIPDNASPEQIAQYQIDYMNRKASGIDNPSSLKLYSGISNVPEVSPGILSIDDAQRFLGAMLEPSY